MFPPRATKRLVAVSPANKDGLGGIEHDEAKDLKGIQHSGWDSTLFPLSARPPGPCEGSPSLTARNETPTYQDPSRALLVRCWLRHIGYLEFKVRSMP